MAITRAVSSALVLCGLAVHPAAAQWGMLWDKLQKLSGPEMKYYGFFYDFGPYQAGQSLAEWRPESLYLEGIGRDSDRWSPLGFESEELAALNSCVAAAASAKDALTSFYDEVLVDSLRTLTKRIRSKRSLWLALSELPSPDRLPDSVRIDFAADVCRQDTLVRKLSEARDALTGIVVRLGAFYGYDQLNGLHDDASDVHSAMLHGSFEDQVPWPFVQGPNLGLEVGVDLHLFWGGGRDLLGYPTFPVLLNVHPFARCEGWALRNLRIGTGVNLVPGVAWIGHLGFPDIPEYEMDDFEAVFTTFFSWDVSGGSTSVHPFSC